MATDRAWTRWFTGIEVEGGDLGEILERAYRPARGGQRSGYRLTNDDLIAVSDRIHVLIDAALEQSSGWAGEAVDTGTPQVDLAPALAMATAERDALAVRLRKILFAAGCDVDTCFAMAAEVVDNA